MNQRYRTWIFDCDGVLLDSNRAKTQAMFEAAKPHGEEAAMKLVEYHKENGGISRFEKFRYFFDSLLKRENYEADMERALARFAEVSKEGLMKAAEADGLRDLLGRIKVDGNFAFVVSGGMQQEIRDVFEARGLTPFFTGIFGSPDSKDHILARELGNGGGMEHPAVYIGDSRYDHEAANRQGIDFVFASGWTEFSDWPDYFADLDVTVIDSVTDFIHAGN